MTLRQSAFAAGRWTTLSLLARAALQLAQVALLARLLAPADFGLMALIGAAYAIASLFADLGLASALIHFPTPSRTALSSLYWLNLGAALLLMVAFIALAWPYALLYEAPALLPAMALMSIAMPLAAIGQQFCIMAEKELRFSALAVIEVAAAACGFLAALAVALAGGGIYALVVAVPVAAAVTSLLAWLLLSQGLRPAFRFDLQAIRPYLRHGSYRMGDSVVSNVQAQADILIGGSVAGAAAMGLYTLPRNLALQLANAVVNPVVTRVGLPVMAKLQEDREALKFAYLQTLRMTAAVNFPVYIALAVWSEEAVVILLGEQWRQAGDFLRVFAVWAMIRSTGNPVGSLVYATGRVRPAFWWNVALLLVVPVVLWVGARLAGAYGLAVTMVFVQLAMFYPLYRLMVYPSCGARFGEYASAFAPPLAASALAVALGFAVAGSAASEGARIVIGAVATAVAYLGASWVINRPWLLAMSELLGPVLRRSR